MSCSARNPSVVRWLDHRPVESVLETCYFHTHTEPLGGNMTDNDFDKLTSFAIGMIIQHIGDTAYEVLPRADAEAFLKAFDASFKGLDADELRRRALAG